MQCPHQPRRNGSTQGPETTVQVRYILPSSISLRFEAIILHGIRRRASLTRKPSMLLRHGGHEASCRLAALARPTDLLFFIPLPVSTLSAWSSMPKTALLTSVDENVKLAFH